MTDSTAFALLQIMKDTGLKKVIESLGSQEALAHAIGVSKQAVSQWQKVPVVRVLEVERVSGVSRYELRPDFYPKDHEHTAA